jgi:outer membrane protein assembly factor BamD (BamD/ComL family)
LLSRAEQQMNDGLAADALKTLAEHERRFPTGSLAEERLAARVQALCMLGRTADAKSDLMRLTRAYPRSPQLERARRVCGFDVGPAP